MFCICFIANLSFFYNKNQLHAVSPTQQGKQREPSISPLSAAEFWRDCMLSGRTQRRAFQSWRRGTKCDCKTDGLWVRSRLEEIIYLLKFIFSFLRSGRLRFFYNICIVFIFIILYIVISEYYTYF